MVLEPPRRILWVTSRDFGSYPHPLVLRVLLPAPIASPWDEALLLLSPGSINLRTVTPGSDEYWISGYQPGWGDIAGAQGVAGGGRGRFHLWPEVVAAQAR